MRKPPGRLTAGGPPASNCANKRASNAVVMSGTPAPARNLTKAARRNATGSDRSTGACNLPWGSSTAARSSAHATSSSDSRASPAVLASAATASLPEISLSNGNASFLRRFLTAIGSALLASSLQLKFLSTSQRTSAARRTPNSGRTISSTTPASVRMCRQPRIPRIP